MVFVCLYACVYVYCVCICVFVYVCVCGVYVDGVCVCVCVVFVCMCVCICVCVCGVCVSSMCKYRRLDMLPIPRPKIVPNIRSLLISKFKHKQMNTYYKASD